MRPLGFKGVHHSKPARPSRSNNLSYHGGVGGIGVETAAKVYLVLWGSQWINDPSGESSTLQSFFQHAGGSPWLNSVTQYCQGVASGTITCGSSGQHAGNPTAIYGGLYPDNGTTAPSSPTQSQLAAEAVKAAGHFGNTSSSSNASVQYVIATSHNNNSSGFGTQYCAWHSSTSSSSGNIAYTNLPYITDAGASCGANFNNLGANAGITIVEGHEMAETATDQFPNGGWLDRSGEENGDKCAWISSGPGASSIVSMNGARYPVQSLWSNAFNNNSGGCVLSYP
jgi:serine protease